MGFKSGFVTIIGRPNVGKSTLFNTIVGEKLSIVSEKPQTTRNALKAIISKPDSQIIFIDTPGVHKPKTKLGEYMVNMAQDTLNEVDAVLFMVEAIDEQIGEGDKYIIDQLKEIKTPVILIINKIDLVKKEQLLALISNYNEMMSFKTIIPISALKNEGANIVMKEIVSILPEGPMYFPEDMITDQSEKVLVSELIREKVLRLLSDEVPHGVGVEVISFKSRDKKDLIDIQANIYCEKDSHKGIIIGKQGAMLKKIGTHARTEIENLLGNKVFLQLWVKVKPDWRNSEAMLKTLGYKK